MINKKTTGFTLVETLVAVVLGVISVTAVFYSYQYFNNSYRGVMDKASISNSARDALSLISRDLRNAGYKDVNYTYDELIGDNFPSHVNPKYRHLYLNDEEFNTIFRMNKDEFNTLAKWKQQKARKRVDLF